MIDYTKTHQQLIKDFQDKKIPIAKPGFYAHPNFLKQLQKDKSFLSSYARFVQTKKYAPKYLERAEKLICLMAETLFDELVKDGRLGACADLSMAFSKMLDKQGIWNYTMGGALSIFFPNQHRRCFAPLTMDPKASIGHVWVVAPPFQIVDCTVERQEYVGKQRNFIPDIVFEKEEHGGEADIHDLCDHHIKAELSNSGYKLNMETMYKVMPQLKELHNFFPTNCFNILAIKMKYVPCGTGFSAVPLEEMTGLKLNGKLGYEIYEELVLPKLKMSK